MTQSRQASYTIQIDVLDDGSLEDAQDDFSARLRSDPGISVSRGRDSARPTAPPMVASASFDLDNRDRVLSPENAGSAYYQLLIPDRTARIQAIFGAAADYDEPVDYDAIIDYDGTTHTHLLTGSIDALVQNPERERRSVTIDCLGSMARLRGTVITAAAMRFQKRTDEIITTILDLAGWPAAARVLATGDTTIEWWWCIEQDAWDALMQVVAAEGAGAALYEDADGLIHFENRNYRVTATRSTTSVATYKDAPAAGELGFQAFKYEPGFKDIYNSVYMITDVRQEDAAFTIGDWKYGSALTLGNNETRIIYARIDTSDPLWGHDSLSAGVHYSLTAGTLASKLVEAHDVITRKITLVAGAGGATIDSAAADGTGFTVGLKYFRSRGKRRIAQTVAGSTLVGSTRIAELAADFGVWPVVNDNTAGAIVDAFASYYRDPRPVVSIEVANRDLAALFTMLREVSDRVHITEAHTGFDRDVWVEQVIQRVEPGRMHRVGLVCSTVLDSAAPALWDSGLWDTGKWGI